ncbi:SAM-dependent methyltransferase [Nocardioidaceae bacterium]|nr:SAM-dependent methyltransferase [Nocardioidaceae bacterium]
MASRTLPLADALAEVAEALSAHDSLVRAVASGRRRGVERPAYERVDVRPIDLRTGPHLQFAATAGDQVLTSNHALGDGSGAAQHAVEQLLAQPWGNWHVETTSEIRQLRVTKKGDAQVSVSTQTAPVVVDRSHDRVKQRLLSPDHPVLRTLGISDAQGRVKPTRQAKYRQVEEMLRLLAPALTEAIAAGRVRTPTPQEPLRVADLGCGNAYLTFAASAHLTEVLGLPTRVIGVDVKQQSADHNTQVAAELGIDAEFVVGTIAEARVDPAPDVVLALHACDTATDEALARAVHWGAGLVLAAPCCHHDVAAQLRRGRDEAPAAYASVLRHGILRERFADTLTDALRENLLRRAGYRVEVVEFVESAHTPRNTLLRAVRRTDPRAAEQDQQLQEAYEHLVGAWSVRPRLAELLDG